MTNTEPVDYIIVALDPTRGWLRPERAFSTLYWVSDSLPYLARRVRTRALSQSRYDSVMDLVAAGLVERRNYVRGPKDGLVELSLTDLGRERLLAAQAASRAIVTGLPVDDGLSVDAE